MQEKYYMIFFADYQDITAIPDGQDMCAFNDKPGFM